MILEAIVSSLSPEGNVNFAPMGVHILEPDHKPEPVNSFVLRLFSNSQTYENLRSTGQGVINFTQDVAVFVETALYSKCLPYVPSQRVCPPSLADVQTLWEFSVIRFDDSIEPAFVEGQVEHQVERAGYGGFCRAQSAVLEATIAATRWQWLPKLNITDPWPMWSDIVRKTGGKRERQAFNRVSFFLMERGIQVAGVPES